MKQQNVKSRFQDDIIHKYNFLTIDQSFLYYYVRYLL
jgi:hypothetical protein